MLFTPDNAQMVMTGLKTQTRRPVQDTDLARMNLHGQIISVSSVYNDLSRRIRWEVGKVYAVQPGRGKKAIGYIKLLSIRKEQLQDISEMDAKAEGVSRLRWEDNPAVWVLEFKLTEVCGGKK